MLNKWKSCFWRNAICRDVNLTRLKSALLVCTLIMCMAAAGAVWSQNDSTIDLTFDDCVATFGFSQRDANFAIRTQYEWLCSFLLYTSNTETLNITMSHDKCLIALLSNLWRLEIHAQLGRDSCQLLALISENTDLLTPTPTRTPRPTLTFLPTRTSTPSPYIAAICESEDSSRALISALNESDIRVLQNCQSYQGRRCARVCYSS